MPDARISSRTSASRILPAVLLCGFAYSGTLASDAPSAPAPEAIYRIEAATRRLEVRDADSVLVQFPEWLTRVRTGDSSVIRITAVRPNCLRVVRLSEGRTTLTALDRKQREYSVELSLVTSHSGRAAAIDLPGHTNPKRERGNRAAVPHSRFGLVSTANRH